MMELKYIVISESDLALFSRTTDNIDIRGGNRRELYPGEMSRLEDNGVIQV